MSWLKESASVLGPDQPVTKYSDEYQFMLKLVHFLGKEGIPRDRIEAITKSRELKTVGDVDMVTTDLWTMATRDFRIPNQYLIDNLK